MIPPPTKAAKRLIAGRLSDALAVARASTSTLAM
jgi:hypothetical protein